LLQPVSGQAVRSRPEAVHLRAEDGTALHRVRVSAVIKIIEHDCTGETRVMGIDCQPYSGNSCGAPEPVADAVRAGFGLNVTDFDLRTFEWHDDPCRAVRSVHV